MDYNERAKKSLYNLENEIESFKEKTEEKWELRKKHNLNIIMAQRKKRILQLSQEKEENNNKIIINNLENNDSLNLNIDDNNETQNINLLNEKNLLLKFPPLENISNNINQIIKFLLSDNIEENKWVIWAIRVYFSKDNIPYNEYSILFENNINNYFEILLNKYQDDIIIINEIFFIITNLFDNDEIVKKYPKKYFEFFLNDNYFLIYQKYIMLQEDELINSILLLLKNILFGNNDLIKNIYYNRKDFFYNLIEFFKEKKIDFEIIKNLILFFSLIFTGIKNNYILDTKLFLLILDTILMIYRIINSESKKDIFIIKIILNIFQDALTCKAKDENENDDYFVLNYLFNGNNKNATKFVSFFCNTLLKDGNVYFNEYSLFIISLKLLYDISYNSTKYQVEQLLKYGLLDILNNIFYFKDNFNNIFQIIEKLLDISNNIIDTDLDFSKFYIKSKIFENLVAFFSLNMANNKIMYIYLNTFDRLLTYNDRQIAENLNKRGIIKDGIFNSLLYFNDKQNELVLLKCKIILSYLNTMYDSQTECNNIFGKEEYLLCYKFKEIILSGQLNISEDIVEALLHSGCMNSIKNIL